MPSQPPPGSLAAYLRAGLAPVAPSQVQPATISALPPQRRSRAPLVVTLLLLLVIAALAAGGYLAWRAGKIHVPWTGSMSP